MAKAITFTEDFTTFSSGKWYRSNATRAAFTGGQLKLTAHTAYVYLSSLSSFDLTGSNFHIELVQNFNAGNNGSITTNFRAEANSTNFFEFEIGGGPTGAVYLRETVDGVATTTYITYNAANFRWLRLREAGGIIYWDVRSETGSWTTLRSKETVLDLTAVHVAVLAGRWAAETDPGNAYLDNLNGGVIPPADSVADPFDNLNEWYAEGVVASGGRMVITPTAAYSFADNFTSFDLSNSQFAWELVQNANHGIIVDESSILTEMIARLDTDNFVGFFLLGGPTGELACISKVAGVVTETSVSYSTDMRWFRIRGDSGTLYWETSKNGATWSIKRSTPSPTFVGFVSMRFASSFYAEETDPGTVVIDNLNMTNSHLLGHLGWRTGLAMPLGGEGGATVQGRNFFPEADWLWEVIPDDPVLDASSAAWGTLLSEEGEEHGIGTYDFAVTVILPSVITGSTPRFTISLANQGAWGDNPLHGMEIPWPEETVIPGSWLNPGVYDGHMCILDKANNRVISLWRATFSEGVLGASWGSVVALDGDGLESGVGSSTGSQLSRLAGIVRVSEIDAGEIPHALFFASDVVAPNVFRYPAQKTDGANLSEALTPIPEGARVQLDPSIDLTAIPGITPGEITVGRALQRYGAYCGDNGGSRMGFIFELADDASGSLSPGSVYSSAGFGWDYFDMQHIPWVSLRVLKNWNGSA